jgi:butyryl-CoA dehydrogenase
MNPYISDEHEALRAVVRDFATSQLEPNMTRWDIEKEFPLDAIRAMGDIGLFGIPFPEPYGQGGDLVGLCIAIEEIARVDQSIAITLEAGVGLGAAPLHRFGSGEQQAKWLPDLCAGRALGAFGLTEPDAGSDAGGTKTKAVLDESTHEWVINGEKAFITNSGTPITSIVTVTALTDAREISTIIVPAGTPGFDVLPPYRKLGWHLSDTHGLTFTDCRVPEDHLLGDRGRGFAQFLEILDEGRIAIAALALGVIRRCVEDATAYAKERAAFGRPIGANQSVAFRCADMHVAAQAAEQLVYHAAWLRDRGEPFKQEAAIAKLYATEAAIDATRAATQVFGGAGYMDDTAVARHYRDAKILEIGEGTSEVQRLVISRALGLPVS